MRINHSTDIVPEGVFLVKEGDVEETQGFDEIERVEEPITRALDFYWSLDNWVHFAPEINCFGRVTAEEIEFTDPDLEDETKEKIRAQIQKIAKPKARLTPIKSDKCELNSGDLGKMLGYPEK